MAERRKPGRPPGSPNRKSLIAPSILKACTERLQASGEFPADASADPLENLLRLALSDKCDIDQQIAIWKELAHYCYPKRKAIELSGQLDTGAPLTTAQTLALVRDALDKRA